MNPIEGQEALSIILEYVSDPDNRGLEGFVHRSKVPASASEVDAALRGGYLAAQAGRDAWICVTQEGYRWLQAATKPAPLEPATTELYPGETQAQRERPYIARWRDAFYLATGLDPTCKAVGFALAWHYNSKTGDCFPSDETLAENLGCSRWVILRARKRLKAEGWIEWKRSKTSSSYSLLIPPRCGTSAHLEPQDVHIRTPGCSTSAHKQEEQVLLKEQVTTTGHIGPYGPTTNGHLSPSREQDIRDVAQAHILQVG